MPRLSSYSILSDPLPNKGYILLNGRTGAVDLISDELANILVYYGNFLGSQGNVIYQPKLRDQEILKDKGHSAEPFDFGSLEISTELIEFLIERGHLTNLSIEDERTQVRILGEVLHEKQSNNPAFLIVPNLDCNYRCTYCFERPLQNDLGRKNSSINYSKSNVVMTNEHIDLVFDSIRQIQSEVGTRGGQIVLYGGEPLDAKNKEVVFKIVEKGAQHDFTFAAISNGHDWEHFLPIMGEKGINQIQVSIDGLKDIHDKRRIHIGHESSFDKIKLNVNRVLNQGGTQVQIRVHIDPSNISSFGQILNEFNEEGWLNHENVIVYANTVYSKNKEGSVHAIIENGELSEALYEDSSKYFNVHIGAADINAKRGIEPALFEGVPFSLRSTYCAANSGLYVFAPDGYIYSCWESVGKTCSRIGSYAFNGGLCLNNEAVEKWFKRSSVVIPECAICPYALVCGGGCAQYSEYNNHTLYRPYCDDFQRVFNKSLAESADNYFRQVLHEDNITT